MGRAVRFLIEGWLAIRFGEDAGRIIRQHGWKVLIAVAVTAAAVLTVRVLRARSRRSEELALDSASTQSKPVIPR